MIAIDPDFADMLPIMKVMNERFLHGNSGRYMNPFLKSGTAPGPFIARHVMLYAQVVALGLEMQLLTLMSMIFIFSFFLLSI
jgi:hypothetical protein